MSNSAWEYNPRPGGQTKGLMFLTHLQATCKEKGCKTQFISTSSHDLCRRHALCAVAVGDLIVWHPYLCDVCSRLLASQYEESQVSVCAFP